MTLLAVILVGAGVGFLGGLFGKGGSAIATPLLHAVGVPAIAAVAAPLPATIPGTLVAARRYREYDLVDGEVVRWAIWAGIPATIVGALLTIWISGDVLVRATDVLVLGLGLRMLLVVGDPHEVVERPESFGARAVAISVLVGLTAGLLANSGGVLLAPLYLAVLRLPLKASFGTSLAVSALLAIPGTVVHASLGHLDWVVVAAFAAGSVPLSSLGAKVALRSDPHKLQRLFGLVLVVLGGVFLLVG
jgi:uncharacterized membrane protein YfcA